MKNYFFILIALNLIACAPPSQDLRQPEISATGKGNGGDGLTMSPEDVEEQFKDLPQDLKKVFTGLHYLYQTEKIIPHLQELGKIDRKIFPEVMDVLKAMFESPRDIFKTLETPDIIKPQKPPCQTTQNYSQAATELGRIGAKICFSSEQISKYLPFEATEAMHIVILALAVHEFAHQYQQPGNDVHNEKVAQGLQAFVQKQLFRHKRSGIPQNISMNQKYYLDKFTLSTHETLHNAQAPLP